MNKLTLAAKKLSLSSLLLGAFIAVPISITAYVFLNSASTRHEVQTSKQTKPLYWVAPMDANYRKDKPGKSPMGMDLVAVYAEKTSAQLTNSPGTIKISSAVINNLGVRTANAVYGHLKNTIDTVGYVQYDEDRLVHIHPRVEGWIEKLYLKAAGETVQEGQALYDIYSPALVNAQEEFLLALQRNNKRLVTAARARLLALQLPAPAIKNLQINKKISQTVTFFAPQAGVISTLNIREGFYVKPGTTIMSIANLEEVWVEAEVFERQAAQVKTNNPITMTLDYLPGKQWQGKIDYIYPTLDAKTRTLKVRLRFNNENGELKPNMFAQIRIHLSSDEAALLIPKQALIRTGSQDRVVLALGDGRFKSIVVHTGRFADEQVEILGGLEEGESVVSSAQFLLDSESSKTSDFLRMQSGLIPANKNNKTNKKDTLHNHKIMLKSPHDEQDMGEEK